ncbi:MAG: hypothetical protein H7Y18_01445 [Clostridiaceae bacterium]|nr:hypothetical protein [Clostridiaceae bacterium]
MRWAYEGIVDIADYVGYPRNKVLTKNHDDEHNVSLEPPQEKDWLDTIGSVRFGDNSI